MSGKRKTRTRLVDLQQKGQEQSILGQRFVKSKQKNSKQNKVPSGMPQEHIDSPSNFKQDEKTNTHSLTNIYSYSKQAKKTEGNKTQTKSELYETNNHTLSGYKKKIVNEEKFEEDSFIRKLNISGLEKNCTVCQKKVCNPTAVKSQNMVHYLEEMCFGIKSRLQLSQTVKQPIVDLCSDFKLCRVASPFDRRVTAIEWHPTQNNIVAVGSKGGDIILWNTQTVDRDKFVGGIGAAGSCQALKFLPWDLSRVVSASINGTVTLHDFEGRKDVILADTMNSYDHWYCSVDVNSSRYMLAAGRNGGILHLMSSEGRKIFEYRLHKNKITHVEFSPREEWLLCTASTDQTVQLWDVRYMKDRKSVLVVLKHQKPVNSAYFSRTDGCRLLTTDQKNEIRVYKAPEWILETTIHQPHRFFQHISPFKATWHPLQDLIICGRYPDKEFPGYQDKEPRTLDLFDAQSGEMIVKLHDPESDGLCPLNKFNNLGDALVSGMGLHIKLWNRKEVIDNVQEQLKQKLLSSDLLSGLSYRQTNRSRSSRNQGQDEDDNLKKKKKRKATTKIELIGKAPSKSLKRK